MFDGSTGRRMNTCRRGLKFGLRYLQSLGPVFSLLSLFIRELLLPSDFSVILDLFSAFSFSSFC